MSEVDDDLRDVFRVLYDDDEIWDQDDKMEVSGGPLETTGNPIGTEVTSRDEEADTIEETKSRYTRKRFTSDLNSLLDRQSDRKRYRIFTPPSLPASSSSVFPSTSPLPPLSEPGESPYQPFSYLALLSRLRSFNGRSFSSYPEPLSPVFFALRGWTAYHREQLTCRICREVCDLGSLPDINDLAVRKEVARRIGDCMQEKHSLTCPWKVTRTPDDCFDRIRTSLHPMLSSSLAPLALTLQRDCAGEYEAIQWVHPLHDDELRNLVTSLERSRPGADDDEAQSDGVTTDLSPITAAMAFFAWYPYPDGDQVDPSAPVDERTQIIACRICQRRVGLWNFGESKSFDLVAQHRDWCPIRPVGKPWWEDIPLLKGKGRSEVVYKGWVGLSEKLEKKPWRK